MYTIHRLVGVLSGLDTHVWLAHTKQGMAHPREPEETEPVFDDRGYAQKVELDPPLAEVVATEEKGASASDLPEAVSTISTTAPPAADSANEL